jgi:tetratricopeptide (TPR) repeat protein
MKVLHRFISSGFIVLAFAAWFNGNGWALMAAETPASLEQRVAKLEASTAPAPVINSGDNAWLLTSAALVLMMTAPGLILFYGGLVRNKNVLATMMHSLILMAMVSILWAVFGYSNRLEQDIEQVATLLKGTYWLSRKALALLLLQRDDEVAAYRKAIELKSAGPTAHYYLGLTFISTKRYPDAVTEFQAAITNGGENLALAHKYLGGLLMNNPDKKQEAANELEKYVTLDPKAADAERIKTTIKDLRSKQ